MNIRKIEEKFEDEIISLNESIQDMDGVIDQWNKAKAKIVPRRFIMLNESVEEKIDNDLVTIETVFKNKSKQFILDNGIILARLSVNINNKIGLKYHYDNSTNVDEFISSVEKFVLGGGNTFSANDKTNLIKHYEKFNKNKPLTS